MNRLAFLANRFDVDLRVEPAIAHVRLNVPDGAPAELVVSEDVAEAAWLSAAATLLHVVELDWPGQRWTVRFPLPGDDLAMRQAIARERRTYRIPYRRGLRTLMPDDWLQQMEDEERPASYAAAEARVGIDDLEVRVREWRTRRGEQPLPTVTDMEEYLERGELQRRREPPPAASWKKGPKPVFEAVMADYIARHPEEAPGVANGPIPF